MRLVLARRAILVEGPSDELIVQRAYYARHKCLPLDNGVEVINVRGLSHKRFLDVAAMTGTPVDIVTDLDKKSPAEHAARFAGYTAREGVVLRVGQEADGTTLEPQFASANSLDTLNQLFGQQFGSRQGAVDWMTVRKADWALRALEYRGELAYPGYINDAVAA